jgi:hypothetical protein
MHATSATLPRVTIDRGDTNESGNAAPVEFAKFRQFGDQGARSDISDTWHGGQQVVRIAPDRRSFDRVLGITIQLGELGLQCL